MKPCEACGGTGWVEKYHPWYGQASCPEPYVDVRCDECNGVGSVAGEEDEPNGVRTDEAETV